MGMWAGYYTFGRERRPSCRPSEILNGALSRSMLGRRPIVGMAEGVHSRPALGHMAGPADH